jgi:hypothetical protein
MLDVAIEFGNIWTYLDIGKNIQLQAHKNKNPSAKAGVFLKLWWPEAELNHRHKDFQLSERLDFR